MADSKNIWSPSPPSDDESFFRGPLGTPLPQDAVDVLDAAFEGHGITGEDGFTNAISRDVTKHRNWGGRVVHVTQDSYEETVQITFYEQNPVVLETVFGDANVDVDYSDGHRKMLVRHEEDPLPRYAFVCRSVEGNKTVTYVIPEGQVTEVDETQLQHAGIWQYTVTIDCFKPAEHDGVNTAAVNVHYDEPDVTGGS